MSSVKGRGPARPAGRAQGEGRQGAQDEADPLGSGHRDRPVQGRASVFPPLAACFGGLASLLASYMHGGSSVCHRQVNFGTKPQAFAHIGVFLRQVAGISV